MLKIHERLSHSDPLLHLWELIQLVSERVNVYVLLTVLTSLTVVLASDTRAQEQDCQVIQTEQGMHANCDQLRDSLVASLPENGICWVGNMGDLNDLTRTGRPKGGQRPLSHGQIQAIDFALSPEQVPYGVTWWIAAYDQYLERQYNDVWSEGLEEVVIAGQNDFTRVFQSTASDLYLYQGVVRSQRDLEDEVIYAEWSGEVLEQEVLPQEINWIAVIQRQVIRPEHERGSNSVMIGAICAIPHQPEVTNTPESTPTIAVTSRPDETNTPLATATPSPSPSYTPEATNTIIPTAPTAAETVFFTTTPTFTPTSDATITSTATTIDIETSTPTPQHTATTTPTPRSTANPGGQKQFKYYLPSIILD